MLLLGKLAEVGEITEIRLELFTLAIVAQPLVVSLYGAFELRRAHEVVNLDPIQQKGQVELLWSLIQRTPTLGDDDGTRFLLELDDGSQIIVRYTSGFEHLAIWGPEPDMWTPLPRLETYRGA